jgi:hypothetical protein
VFVGGVCASLPHTPAGDSTHNLVELNDKLLALSQKLQREQIDETSNAIASVGEHEPVGHSINAGGQTSAMAATHHHATAPLHLDTLNDLASALQKVRSFRCSIPRHLYNVHTVVA